jgi:hypothetical protein
MRAADFSTDAGVVTVRQSKAGKPRHVVLTDEGQRLFASLTVGKLGDEAIFARTDGGMWGKSHQLRPTLEASERAKIKPAISFHVLRHTHGSTLAMRGVPMGVIAEQLGHADTRMTEKHYAHLAPSYVADTIRAHFPTLGIGDDVGVVSLQPRPSPSGTRADSHALTPCVLANRSTNNQGDGTLFDRSAFLYQPDSDTYSCPAGRRLVREQIMRRDNCVVYAAQDCCGCALKPRCTNAKQRLLTRHFHEDALQRMNARIEADPDLMRQRRCAAEHPFGTIKRMTAGGRFLTRGITKVKAEAALSILAYNILRAINLVGPFELRARLA